MAKLLKNNWSAINHLNSSSPLISGFDGNTLEISLPESFLNYLPQLALYLNDKPIGAKFEGLPFTFAPGTIIFSIPIDIRHYNENMLNFSLRRDGVILTARSWDLSEFFEHNFSFYLDRRDRELSGWSLDRNRPGWIYELILQIDGCRYAVAQNDQSRADLRKKA